MEDDFDFSSFLSGNMSDPASGDAGAIQNGAWYGGQVAPEPMVSPYPSIDPALMGMMGLGQAAPAAPQQAPQSPAIGGQGGGGGAARPLQQAQLMPMANTPQVATYPGLPPAASTIGQAGKSC